MLLRVGRYGAALVYSSQAATNQSEILREYVRMRATMQRACGTADQGCSFPTMHRPFAAATTDATVFDAYFSNGMMILHACASRHARAGMRAHMPPMNRPAAVDGNRYNSAKDTASLAIQ